MRNQLTMILILAAAGSQLGADGGCGQPPILRDPGFDLWCGDQLCVWKIARGDARRVPTWHESDAGVELIGPDAAISQLTSASSGSGSCIRFDLVANVEENVEARLEVDVFGDGSIDLSERMPTSHWKPLSYKIKIAPPYSGVRFQISKVGNGRAVFAQIAADYDTDCEGLPELATVTRPLGAPCTLPTSCDSGLCEYVSTPGSWFGVTQACVACKDDTCSSGEVCGRGEAISGALLVPHTCVATGSHELGEQCRIDDECATGLCFKGVCSTCNTTCAGGEQCSYAYVNGPWVCSPSLHNRATNEACATDNDCVSGHCDGAVRKQCADGRACDGPGDCPIEDDLAPGACSQVGIQGGRCQ
jgi:hypothetical protein